MTTLTRLFNKLKTTIRNVGKKTSSTVKQGTNAVGLTKRKTKHRRHRHKKHSRKH